MTFRGDISRSGGKARKGGGGGRGMAVGGGLGGLLLVGLFVLLGGNPAQIPDMLGQGEGQGQGQAQLDTGETFDHCQTGEDANTYDDCRLLFTMNSTTAMWKEVLPTQAGMEYEEPGLVDFEGSTQSGCGFASASTGPFYCPTDKEAYFDTSFFDQMRQFGGEDAPFAQMYIVAHEIGHHVQNLEGTLGLSNYNDPGADSNAVMVELQADCYAGIWASYADKGPDRMLEPITEEQLDAALTTAAAVGDDNIQRRSGGEVNPESWTHGSSEQRRQAFLDGYTTGQMSSCDYLDRGVYRTT
ncbi:KPN_02809 family neutral zinc metallopeptidase [Corynebacterium gallinarum]|uniref:Neutral zinc metallopeptidase n=1 Tax=Corynebacterium gallinarum TaxID=2762214 RepID=A0A8I0LB03_9CORY|nr:neutral zinc metallopeptidase [Corynebacterium gallinarum]MBD8030317.1 neutral zinc metallopeptidase [Corynebacterium gallinarum]